MIVPAVLCNSFQDLYRALSPQDIGGPMTYVGAANGYWVLPNMLASEGFATGTLVGREVHIANGSNFNLNLVTYSGAQPFGHQSRILVATIAANGSIGIIGNYNQFNGSYFWQMIEQNGVTLTAGLIMPAPGAAAFGGLAPKRTP